MHKIIRISVLFTILLSASANARDCSMTSSGITPLYPSIFVPRTAEEQSAALAAVNSIPPGPTVTLSVGMSNARTVWLAFKSDAEGDPLKNPDVQVVNAALGGGSTSTWADVNELRPWDSMDNKLRVAGRTREDVSVIWFMIHNGVGQQTLDEYTTNLDGDVRTVLDRFEIEFPNLKIVWLQSMIYAGYSSKGSNKEPFAHQSGNVAQNLVANQGWPFFVGHGPYLWADGLVPRDDGLIWRCTDFVEKDGHHPDVDGEGKAADLLMQFFHEDSVASIGYLDNGELLTVPDVVGLDQVAAEASIVSAGLSVGAVSTANSDTVVAGNVISQNPSGGSMAASGRAVDLVVSLGPAQLTTVPDVVGLDQVAAEASIVSASLVVGTVSTANSDTVVAGNVISQTPAGGSMAASGTTVDLVVSLGPLQLTTIPDVVGLDQATAEASIVSASLVVGTVSMVNSDTVVVGNVISQSPTGGSLVASGTAVDLVVSLGTATGIPMMISPADGSTISGSSETFNWSAAGAAVDRWRLEVGTTPGGRDLFVKGLKSTVTSVLVSGLPTDGSLVYVNLKWRIGGASSVASYVYTASGGEP